ncbi:DUF1007 family protein [Salinicola acroporae]|uniref:DUF1007 domain-containing protein n=1 Tax=Salinicola acroporae TaxID=1541440 RepID=A0ABT6IAB8_9GAMM|nr:DUF1007 family protein [Salinicola acroporae]MDH4574511.1 DUF1007 domain-containing protein [Salinicola acroporae]
MSVLLGASPAALAHPHGWVDMSVEGVFDDQGNLTALRQRWRMDPFYSQVVMEEMATVKDGTSMAQRLDALGLEIRNNLATQHNLTNITLDGQPVAQGDVTDTNTDYRDDRLVYEFVLPLSTPQRLAGHTLSYRIFDPTYYIEMVHEANEDGSQPLPDALTLDHPPAGCTTRIVKATPDPQKVMEAAMLDKGENGEPNLGRFFAETGEITCPA